MAGVWSEGSRLLEAYSVAMTNVIHRIDEISTELELSSEKAVDDLKRSVASLVDHLMARERHLSLQIDECRMEMGVCLRDMKEKLQKAVVFVKEPEYGDERKRICSSHDSDMTQLGHLTQSMASDVERVGKIGRMRFERTLEEGDLKKAIDSFGHQSDVHVLLCAQPFKSEVSSLTAFQECLDRVVRNGRASDKPKWDVESGLEQDGSTPCQMVLRTRQKKQKSPTALESSTIQFGSSTRGKSETDNISKWLYRPELPCPNFENRSLECDTEVYSHRLEESCKWDVGSGWTSSSKQDRLNEKPTSNGMILRKLQESTPQKSAFSNAGGNKRNARKPQEGSDISQWLHKPRALFQDSNDMKKWLKQETPTAPTETTLSSNPSVRLSDLPKGLTQRNGALDLDQCRWSRRNMTSSSGISPAEAVCLALERHKATPKEMWLFRERRFSNAEPEDDINQCVRNTSNELAVQQSTARNDSKREDYRKWLVQGQKSYFDSLHEDYHVWLAPNSDRCPSPFFPDDGRRPPMSFQELLEHHLCYLRAPSPIPIRVGFNSAAKALISSGSGMDNRHSCLSSRSQSPENAVYAGSVSFDDYSELMVSLDDSEQGDSEINPSVDSQRHNVDDGCQSETECEEFEVITTGGNTAMPTDDWEYQPKLLLQEDSH